MKEREPAGRLNQVTLPERPRGLRGVQLDALVAELAGRLREGAFGSEATVQLGRQLQDALAIGLDIHCNRMSARRYRDMFGLFQQLTKYTDVPLDGKTVVDLGCGSVNPYGMLFVFLMVGAQRGVAIDLDPIQDDAAALRALAECAGMMLVDPTSVVGNFPITRKQVLGNLDSFDLSLLRLGNPAGMDRTRLRHRQESITALSLETGEADLVMSNSLFEHVPDVPRAIAELARVTAPGGLHIHNIDGSDHRRYATPGCSPLGILTEETTEPLPHGCNRIRPAQFIPLFEQRGFELVEFFPFEVVELDSKIRSKLVEPFRSMPDHVLATVGGRLYLRRKANP